VLLKPWRPRRPNHERWLVSYADFVTLLFAFFVVLYANAGADRKNVQAIAASFRAAVGDKQLQSALEGLIAPDTTLPADARTGQHGAEQPLQSQKSAELLPSVTRLNQALEKEIRDGRLEVRMERRGLIISLHEASLFASGDSAVLPGIKETLRKIAEHLRPLPNAIRFEGHTDSIPIHNPRFRSNWELSAARSISLMEMFAGDFGMARNRLSVSGFAETAPVASNDTAEGRARNRRVDIVVLTIAAALSEPQAIAQSAH
jgi:chemotaxis protein MotB